MAVNAGATLQLQGGITVGGKNLTLAGTGFGNAGALPQGALVNQANNNTWAGNIVLTGSVKLTADTIPLLTAANTGTLIGAVNGTTLFVTGVVSGTDLAKVGPGTVQLLGTTTGGVSTYTVLGLDVDLFTPIFAVSRISGWTAHVIEQLDDNRLIRPRADYIGPKWPNKYIPIDQR